MTQIHAIGVMKKMIKSVVMFGSMIAASAAHSFAKSEPVDATAVQRSLEVFGRCLRVDHGY